MKPLCQRPACPVVRARRPTYPTLLAAGMMMVASACGGSKPSPVAPGGTAPPAVEQPTTAPAQTIATTPDEPGPEDPDVMLDGEAPAPFEHEQ